MTLVEHVGAGYPCADCRQPLSAQDAACFNWERNRWSNLLVNPDVVPPPRAICSQCSDDDLERQLAEAEDPTLDTRREMW